MEIKKSWSDIKSLMTMKSLALQYDEPDRRDYYVVYLIDGPVLYQTVLDKGSDDAIDFENNYQSSANNSLGIKTSDDIPMVTHVKSYRDSSKSFTTPDFANRQSWFYDTTQITDEIMTTSDDLVYSSIRTPTSGWDHDWLKWDCVPNHVRQTTPSIRVVVKKNDTIITSGFSIDYKNGTVTFSVANESTDEITVTYKYGNSSTYDLQANPGKILKVDYIETQFSVGSSMPEDSVMIFQAIYNGPAIPSMGIPADYDIPISKYEYYNAKDFLNESTQAYQVKAFMELERDVNILPWHYLTGHTIKSPGDPTTDLSKGEFNKLRMRIMDLKGGPDPIISDCEIATGTVYCIIKDS